jgi:hypothetical protein
VLLVSYFLAFIDTKKPSNCKDIWEEGDVKEGQEFEDIHDPRPQPEY